MLRVVAIEPRSASRKDRVIDTVVLDAGDRQRRRIVLTGEKGTRLLLDFPNPVTLRDGDALMLDDGSAVAVRGAKEALLEVSAPSPLALLRLAWHIGNRHADLQLAGERLRIRRDHVLAEMVRGLGGTVAPVEAPFDPESGRGHRHDE